jgi:hypothetical protein
LKPQSFHLTHNRLALALLLCRPAPQVVVHNLPWSTTWQQLKDLFKEWKVERADVVYDTWGKSRCVPWLQFL